FRLSSKSENAGHLCPIALAAMIGMTGEDRDSAVELFGQEDTHELVRPGELSEAERGVGALVERGVEPVGAADGDHQVTLAAIAKARDQIGKAGRIERFAAL